MGLGDIHLGVTESETDMHEAGQAGRLYSDPDAGWGRGGSAVGPPPAAETRHHGRAEQKRPWDSTVIMKEADGKQYRCKGANWSLNLGYRGGKTLEGKQARVA